jgi:hypothetical protein
LDRENGRGGILMKRTMSVILVGLLIICSYLGLLTLSGNTHAQGSDIVATWHFDEGSGTVVSDSSGNGYDGAVHGATWTTGISGGALDFDGLDDYVGIVNSSSLDNLNALTFEAWIYPRINAHWHVISKGTGSKRLYSEAYQSTLDLTGRVRYQPTHAYATSIDNTVTLNSWQHVVMTWSTTDDTLRVFLNGEEVSYSSLSAGVGTIEDDSSHPYTIGARSDLAAGCLFNGIIDEVRIYNRALSAQEIKGIYPGEEGGNGNGGDGISSFLPPIIAVIAFIIILILFLLMKKMKQVKAGKTVIDEVFFMYNDGRLIKHFTRRLRPDMDEDILSSMLVAVQDFIKDSFQDHEGVLDEMRFGRFQVILGRGKYIILATIVLGDEYEPFRPQVKKCVEDIEEKYAEVLDGWDGDLSTVRGASKFIMDLIDGRYA